ncbi:unnamed protein product [Urochloa humidicola]
MEMDSSERQVSQPKKSRKSLPTSRRSTGVPATSAARTGVPPSSLGVASGAFVDGSCATSPSLGGGTSCPQGSSAFWARMSQASDPINDSEWMYPPGGFVNSLQMPYLYASANQLPENSHFVGGPSTRGTPSPNDGTNVQETIDVDADDTLEPARTDKRLNWSHEEDVRLASAWLHNSLDPVDGNDKKADKYWADVTDTYNSTTPSNRRRNRNQLKIRWDRIKKPVSEFHGSWVKATRVFQSGESDDQRTDHALQIYASEHNDKPFLLQHICGSTSGLSEEAKAERSKALESMRLALFANPN